MQDVGFDGINPTLGTDDNVINKYFSEYFPAAVRIVWLACVPRVPLQHNDDLCAPYTDQDLQKASRRRASRRLPLYDPGRLARPARNSNKPSVTQPFYHFNVQP